MATEQHLAQRLDARRGRIVAPARLNNFVRQLLQPRQRRRRIQPRLHDPPNLQARQIQPQRPVRTLRDPPKLLGATPPGGSCIGIYTHVANLRP